MDDFIKGLSIIGCIIFLIFSLVQKVNNYTTPEEFTELQNVVNEIDFSDEETLEAMFGETTESSSVSGNGLYE